MCALLLLILCECTSHSGGVCVCTKFDIFTFFFAPFLTSPKSGFPCYFLPSPLTIGGGVPWAEMLHQHVCCSRHSFLLMSVEEKGGWVDGWRGTFALSFSLSLSGSLLHSTPFIATPTGPALRRSLPAFYRTANVTRLPDLCLFFPSTTVLPLYSRLMVPLCILLPFLWSVSFLPCLPFPHLWFSLIPELPLWIGRGLVHLCCSVRKTASFWQFTDLHLKGF